MERYSSIDLKDLSASAKLGFNVQATGCLMLSLDIPQWHKIVSLIGSEDIYSEEGFGLEEKPHVTILYGFHNDVPKEDVLAFAGQTKLNDVTLVEISIFETDPDYEVVKFDVDSPTLHDLHEALKSKFPNSETWSDYKPHVTIGYVKHGTGKKYLRRFEKPAKVRTSGWSWKGD